MTAALQPILVEIHKGQRMVLESLKRIILCFSGTGSGKTTIGVIWLVQEIQKFWDEPADKNWYAVVAPTTDLLAAAQNALAPFLTQLGDTSIGDDHDGYRRSTREWHLANGAVVRFRSADNPRALEGVHYRAIWFDEAAQVPDATWNTVIRRGAFFKARILVTSTYYLPTPDWVLNAVENERTQLDTSTCVISFPSNWNPAYPQDEWERLKATLPDWEFGLFYESRLVKPAGAVYPNFDINTHVIDGIELGTPILYGARSQEEEPRPVLDAQGKPRYEMWPVYSGMDFGTTNPTAILWAAYDEANDRLIIFKEFYETGRNADQIAAELSAEPKPEQIFLDPAAASIKMELRQRDHPVLSADNDIQDGTSEVYSRLATGRLLFVRGSCPSLLREIERYRRNSSGAIVKKDDHAVDALRYLCMGIRKVGGQIVLVWG